MGIMMSKNIIDRFEGADGIRGFACFIVLITHAVSMFFVDTVPYLAGTGKFGVWLFFVLSAFLLTHRFLKMGFGINMMYSYAIGRFFRIIPLFAIAIVVYYLCGTANINTWENVADVMFFSTGAAHLWTIPVEVKFYFFLPFFSWFGISLKKKLTAGWVVFIFFLIILGFQGFWPFWKTPINSIQLRWYLGCFLIGINLMVSFEDFVKITQNIRDFLCLLMVVVLILLSPGFHLQHGNDLANKFLVVSIIWACFIVCCVQGKGLMGTFLKNSIFFYLGKWSYSIYLFHWLVYMKIIQNYRENMIAMIFAIVGAIFLGALIYNIIEYPLECFRYRIMSYLRNHV
jgi:peptidoglycan/LPS O-acetylase OafA/YrhL